MKPHHRFMLTAALVASAGAFRLASRLLDSAIHHKGKLNEDDDEVDMNDLIGFYHDGVDVQKLEPPTFYKTTIVSPNKWIDAEPCSDFDDYRSK